MRMEWNGGRPSTRMRANPRAGTRWAPLRTWTAKLACGAAALCCAAALCRVPAHALQVLEAVDHAELEAEISATAVNRIALDGDRIVRVVQAPGGLTVEHDAVRGDIYIHPDRRVERDGRAAVLYLGTERGLTYRLSLNLADRGPAQILVRNRAVASRTMEEARGGVGRDGSRTGELVRLIQAVARREPLAGYAIEPAEASGRDEGPVRLVETWRGPRWTARVLAVADGESLGAGELASHDNGRAAAAWVSESASTPHGGRLAAIVEAADETGAGR